MCIPLLDHFLLQIGFVLRPICGHSALLLTLAMDHCRKTLYGCSFQKDVKTMSFVLRQKSPLNQVPRNTYHNAVPNDEIGGIVG